jgi:hypothetical protein
MAILGIFLDLHTFDGKDAGTDDEIYLGMWGKAGGREFPLSSSSIDDFERGSDVAYLLGLDLGFGFTPVHPDRSKPAQANDPARVPIDLHSIEYVYLRKQAYGTGAGDDTWQIQSITVLMYEAETLPFQPNEYRMFYLIAPKGLWLGNEHGHQVWLTEGFDERPRESLQAKAGRTRLFGETSSLGP